MKDSLKRRNAVARVMAAEDKGKAIEAEAKRAGKDTRTIERWVAAAKAASPAVATAVSENAPPPEKPAESTVLDTLLKDGEKPADGPITAAEVSQGAADAERFCVETYAMYKSAVGGAIVSWQYTPPLDATSPEVLKILQAGKAAELAIRANAPWLYPILAKAMSNKAAVIGAVVIDSFAMLMALASLAKSKGWTPAAKKASDKPAPAEVPTPQNYGEQLRTATASSGQAEVKGAETVVNAPLPTPEQLQAAAAVRQVLVA